jgi:hypothetical protein
MTEADLEKLRYHNTTYEALVEHFRYGDEELPEGFPSAAEVVLASEWEALYEGALWIVWQRGGQLFEIRASHCSCNSFHDERESFKTARPVTIEAIAMEPHWSIGERKGITAVALDAFMERRLMRGALLADAPKAAS